MNKGIFEINNNGELEHKYYESVRDNCTFSGYSSHCVLDRISLEELKELYRSAGYELEIKENK
jgi:hypothetical protein